MRACTGWRVHTSGAVVLVWVCWIGRGRPIGWPAGWRNTALGLTALALFALKHDGSASAWSSPAMVLIGLGLCELIAWGSWRAFGYLAVGLLTAAAVITAVSLVCGLRDGGLRDSGLLEDFVTGHVALLLLAAGQFVGWWRHEATGGKWWWRLEAWSTAGAVVFGLGLLIAVTGPGSEGGDLRASCWNLVRVMAFGLTVGLVMPLLVAEIMFQLTSDRWKYAYRVLFIIPMVVPGIVGTLMWRFIYSNDGVLNQIIDGLSNTGVQFGLLLTAYGLAAYLVLMALLARCRRGDSNGWPALLLIILLAAWLFQAAAYAAP